MNSLADLFARQGYVVCRGLLQDPQLSSLHRYARMRAESGTMPMHDRQVSNTPVAYGDFMMDGLLSDLLPDVERACGLNLFPTYSYFRHYKGGDGLARHKDRPACEISVSLCLGYDAPQPWPIWIEGYEAVTHVVLEPGDGMLYRGIDCAHWRDPLPEGHVMQVFLHYVDGNGPHADWKFDKRPALAGLPCLPRP